MTEQGTLLEFPCRFPIKAMGRNRDEFQATVTGIIDRHASLFEQENVTVNESAEGNFLSVTVTIEAVSQDQLDAIYRDLTECGQVLMAL